MVADQSLGLCDWNLFKCPNDPMQMCWLVQVMNKGCASYVSQKERGTEMLVAGFCGVVAEEVSSATVSLIIRERATAAYSTDYDLFTLSYSDFWVTDSIYSYFSHFYFMETFDNFYIFCHFHSNKTEMKVLKVTDRAFMLK